MDKYSLSHTTWCCKYHIVFAPKYRRKAFYGSKRLEIGTTLRQLCRWKGINILEAEVCPDHVHMLLEMPPKYSVSSIMGYIKGKSSLLIYEKWGNAKFRYRKRVLVQRLLCRYDRKEYENNIGVYKETVKRGCRK